MTLHRTDDLRALQTDPTPQFPAPPLVKIFVATSERATTKPLGHMMDLPMRDHFHWARILSFVTGLVNQELLLRNEYLVAENRILRAHLPARLRLSDAERSTLAEIAKRLGRRASRRSPAWPSRIPFSPGTGGQPLLNAFFPP